MGKFETLGVFLLDVNARGNGMASAIEIQKPMLVSVHAVQGNARVILKFQSVGQKIQVIHRMVVTAHSLQFHHLLLFRPPQRANAMRVLVQTVYDSAVAPVHQDKYADSGEMATGPMCADVKRLQEMDLLLLAPEVVVVRVHHRYLHWRPVVVHRVVRVIVVGMASNVEELALLGQVAN